MSRNRMPGSSLRWRFTLGFIILQLITIVASLGLVLYIATLGSPGGAVPSAWLRLEVASSVVVSEDGQATIKATPGLEAMMKEWPALWFVVRLQDGSMLTNGSVPSDIAANFDFLSSFRSVELRGYVDTPDRQGTVDKMETEAGTVIIFAGGVSWSLYQLTFVAGQVAIGVPALILTIITVLGVPWVTKWSLGSLDKLTERLGRIDFKARGTSVDARGLPKELVNVVKDINLVLGRLDAGFEQTERFFVNAAHELRTPIAILQVRADTLPPSEEKLHIQRGVKRLTAITNQLLDIEKYRQTLPPPQAFDLTKVAAKVVADLAPVAIAEGYDISFETEVSEALIEGEPEAMERALANLLRNAIQYGGERGNLAVHVEADGSVIVADQGIGIPKELLPRIFEPFYRVNPHGSGAGLGLSMVNEIVERHRGFIEIESSPGQGSTFALRWRKAPLTKPVNQVRWMDESIIR